MKDNIKKSKVFLFDLDGTVYVGDKPIGNVAETMNFLRGKGIRVGYLTNNSSVTKEFYIEKLVKMGLWEEGDFFYSSLDSAIDYISDNMKDDVFFPVATERVSEYIKSKGVKMGEDATAVLLTFDKELTYKKLAVANELLVFGKKYVATHPDATCPAPLAPVPDVGSFMCLLEKSSGRTPDVVTGKPYGIMAENVIKALKVRKEDVTMVGDFLLTDIAFGVNGGFNTIMVLTGHSTEEQAEKGDIHPDLILKDVNELTKII